MFDLGHVELKMPVESLSVIVTEPEQLAEQDRSVG